MGKFGRNYLTSQGEEILIGDNVRFEFPTYSSNGRIVEPLEQNQFYRVVGRGANDMIQVVPIPITSLSKSTSNIPREYIYFLTEVIKSHKLLKINR